MLPLLKNAAQKYQKRKQPLPLISHLFQLDTPFLFTNHLPSRDSSGLERDSLTMQAFSRFLEGYIRDNKLARSILQGIDELLVSLDELYFLNC